MVDKFHLRSEFLCSPVSYHACISLFLPLRADFSDPCFLTRAHQCVCVCLVLATPLPSRTTALFCTPFYMTNLVPSDKCVIPGYPFPFPHIRQTKEKAKMTDTGPNLTKPKPTTKTRTLGLPPVPLHFCPLRAGLSHTLGLQLAHHLPPLGGRVRSPGSLRGLLSPLLPPWGRWRFPPLSALPGLPLGCAGIRPCAVRPRAVGTLGRPVWAQAASPRPAPLYQAPVFARGVLPGANRAHQWGYTI